MVSWLLACGCRDAATAWVRPGQRPLPPDAKLASERPHLRMHPSPAGALFVSYELSHKLLTRGGRQAEQAQQQRGQAQAPAAAASLQQGREP